MKKATVSSLVLLQNLNKLTTPNEYSTCVRLSYNTPSFRSIVVSVGNLYKKLSNGKITLIGLQNNREWWKKNGCSGLYFYTYTRSEIEVVFFIKSKKKISEIELRSRIAKILKPKEMIVKFDDPEEFVNYFSDLSIVESGFQYFGNSHQIGEINVNPKLTISTL